jgi:hypothetical protein
MGKSMWKPNPSGLGVVSWVLAVACAAGCSHDGGQGGSLPLQPSILPPEGSVRVGRGSEGAGTAFGLRLVAVEPGVMPYSARVAWNGGVRRLGPTAQWTTAVPHDGATPWWIEVDPLSLAAGSGDALAFYRLAWSSWASPPDSFLLPLVPHRPLRHSVYREAIDLLQEFIAPFSGSRLRRWSMGTLRLALPSGEWPVDYRAACREAMTRWNEVLGSPRFVAVETGAAAEVRCEVSEETRLAYTQLVDADDHGRPLAMRVHLSPRWAPGSEHYVRRVYLHELGHALGLWGHSVDLQHILNGRAVIVDDIHPDEALVARWFWSLPADFDLVALGRPPRTPPGISPPQRQAVTRCEVATERGTEVSRPW